MFIKQITKTIDKVFGSRHSGDQDDIRLYESSGRLPWSHGYKQYRARYIRNIIIDSMYMNRFASNSNLPGGHGLRLDERVVEYPWILSRLGNKGVSLLDAGSALNHAYLLDLDIIRCRKVVICTLAPEAVHRRNNISYVYDDLRNTMFRNEYFDDIVCISTLEHVGMDNTLHYIQDIRFKEQAGEDYRLVVREFARILKPGGKLYISVPVGVNDSLGWMQMFDSRMIARMVDSFEGTVEDSAHFKYSAEGWQFATAAECADCRYFDVNKRGGFDPDFAAAARAVCCLMLEKKS